MHANETSSGRFGSILLDGITGNVRNPINHLVTDLPLVDETQELRRRNSDLASRFRCSEHQLASDLPGSGCDPSPLTNDLERHVGRGGVQGHLDPEDSDVLRVSGESSKVGDSTAQDGAARTAFCSRSPLLKN